MVNRPAARGAAERVHRRLHASGGSSIGPLAAGLIVAVPLVAVYLRTLQPDVGFWDTAEFQAVGPVLGIAHPTGFPAYTLLAWLASVVLQPFGNEALRANMLSALVVAGGVGIVASTVTLLTGRVVAGIAAGAALGITVETWAVGLHADPHALHVLLVAILLLQLVVWGERTAAGLNADRWLLGAAVVFGISLANHGLTILLAPGIAAYLWLVNRGLPGRPRLVVTCAAAMFLTAAALYAYLPIRSAMNPPLDYANPQTLDGFLYMILAEQFRGSFRAPPPMLEAFRLIIGEAWQLGLIGALALAGGVTSARRRPALLVLLATWFGINWLFALFYDNAEIGRYYIVPLLTVAVLGGIGAADLVGFVDRFVSDRGVRRRLPRLATVAVSSLVAVVLVGPTLIALPARLAGVDQSSDRLGREWLTAVAAAVPQDSVIVSWWSYSTTLWYGQYVERLRPDVTVIDDSTIVEQTLGDPMAVIDSYLGERPVFLIRLPSDMPAFEARYVLTPLPQVPSGPLYRVDRLRGLAAAPARL